MEIGLGASTWATGNQPCSGSSGIFTPKPMSRPRKSRICVSVPSDAAPSAIAAMSKVCPGEAS